MTTKLKFIPFWRDNLEIDVWYAFEQDTYELFKAVPDLNGYFVYYPIDKEKLPVDAQKYFEKNIKFPKLP